MKIKTHFFFLFLFSYVTLSQEKNIEVFYQKYFENTREIPHLHLNKTTFLAGEKIWFQAYIKESNSGTLHPTTSNLYVSIFEESGKLKEQHLIEINNGIGSGNISIDSSFVNNSYYLRATTKWMKNFKEDNAYQQKIIVLSSKNKKDKKVATLKKDDFFEFKLFPEGGHYLANTDNSVGILIKDSNNNGIEIKEGVIKNSDDEIIETFTTNKFGLGKISFFLPEDETYTFETELPNGSIVSQQTESSRKIGVLLKATNKTEKIEVVIETNPTSAALLKNKSYSLFVHNIKSYNKFQIKFNPNNFKYVVVIDKKTIAKGINIITLFNEENNAVSERLMYNDNSDLFFDVKLEKINASKDSLLISINNNTNEKILLSTSILPVNTKAYSKQNTIKSSFILKPFLRGKLENPHYYFDKGNKDRLEKLDLLLITQGWSKYNWAHIFDESNIPKYKFENGIDVKFNLNRKLKKNQTIVVFSGDNNIIHEIKPGDSNYFLENSFLKKDSKFYFGLKTNNNFTTKISPSVTYSSNSLTDVLNKKIKFNNQKSELEVSNFKTLADAVTTLDEVIVKSKKRKKTDKVYGVETMFTTFKMEKMLVTGGDLVLDFLRNKRFDVQINAGEIFIGKRRVDRNNSESSSSDNYTRQLRNVRLYLDGNEITQSLWILEGLYLNTLKSISFGQDPALFNESIYMFSLSPQEYSRKNSEFNELYLPVGFATQKEYYSPKYPSFLEDTYINYGAIYWKSLISIDKNSVYKFKLPTNKQKEIKILIEGISESGKLITKEANINVKKAM